MVKLDVESCEHTHTHTLDPGRVWVNMKPPEIGPQVLVSTATWSYMVFFWFPRVRLPWPNLTNFQGFFFKGPIQVSRRTFNKAL